MKKRMNKNEIKVIASEIQDLLCKIIARMDIVMHSPKSIESMKEMNLPVSSDIQKIWMLNDDWLSFYKENADGYIRTDQLLSNYILDVHDGRPVVPLDLGDHHLEDFEMASETIKVARQAYFAYFVSTKVMFDENPEVDIFKQIGEEQLTHLRNELYYCVYMYEHGSDETVHTEFDIPEEEFEEYYDEGAVGDDLDIPEEDPEELERISRKEEKRSRKRSARARKLCRAIYATGISRESSAYEDKEIFDDTCEILTRMVSDLFF